MGFRSTMTTEHIWLEMPDWFVKKHEDLHIGEVPHGSFFKEEFWGKRMLPISYKFEHKFHDEFLEDLQRVLREQPEVDKEEKRDNVELILFHECDGVTRVRVWPDRIQYFEPQDWEEVDDITHNYCYGCSEPRKEK